MARNKTLTTYIVLDIVFLLCAALHLFIPLYTRSSLQNPPTLSNIASNLLLSTCPLTPSIINSGIMFIAFLISLPAITIARKNRTLLQIQAWLIVACAIFTLGIGLKIWFSTLQTKQNLLPVWDGLDTFEQSMLQWRFQCCGYQSVTSTASSSSSSSAAAAAAVSVNNTTAGNNAFIQDGLCKSVAVAVTLGGCEDPFSVFANKFLDIVFTTFFGFVAVDMVVLLGVLCVLKERREQERYVLIEEKGRGAGI